MKDSREKPKCNLIRQDGNIFNLMGIKQNGQYDESKEMIDKITTTAKSYEEALCIISDYVEITSEEELYNEEEFE